MKNAYVRAKDSAKGLMYDEQNSPEEFAEERVQYATEITSSDIGHIAVSQGKKAVQIGRDAIRERRDAPGETAQSFNSHATQDPRQNSSQEPVHREIRKSIPDNPEQYHVSRSSEPIPTEKVQLLSEKHDPLVISLPAESDKTKGFNIAIREGLGREMQPRTSQPIQRGLRTERSSRIRASNTRHEKSLEQEDRKPRYKTNRQIRQTTPRGTKYGGLEETEKPTNERTVNYDRALESTNVLEAKGNTHQEPARNYRNAKREIPEKSYPSNQVDQLFLVEKNNPALNARAYSQQVTLSVSEQEITGTGDHTSSSYHGKPETLFTRQAHRVAGSEKEHKAKTAVTEKLPHNKSRTISKADESLPKGGRIIKKLFSGRAEGKSTDGRVKLSEASTESATSPGPLNAFVMETPKENAVVQTHKARFSGIAAPSKPSGKKINEEPSSLHSGIHRDSTVVKHRNSGRLIREDVRKEGLSYNHPIQATDTASKASKTKRRTPQTSIKTAERTANKAVKRNLRASTRVVNKSTDVTLKTSRQVTRTAREAARVAAATAKAAAKATLETVKTVISGVKEMTVAIAAGGGVAIMTIIMILLVGLLLLSPFGLFFSGDNRNSGAVPVSIAVAQVSYDFNAQLEDLQSGEYDGIDLSGTVADWPEMLSIFAVKVAGSEDVDATDVATLDATRIEKLEEVFWDMNTVTAEVETIDYPDSDPDDEEDDSWSESYLHLQISPKTAEEMISQYHFSEKQKAMLEEMLEARSLLMELVEDLRFYSSDAEDVLRHLPDDLSDERRKVVEAACSLVGKVNYFWGGKSIVLGWDSQWGTVQRVWAEESPTTGTFRPYGLDCSGFVDWVFYNASDGAQVLGHGGGAAAQHSFCRDVSWEEAMPGDLVFYPEDDHVGIISGRCEENLLAIHCSSGGVVITNTDGFTSIGRPLYYSS